MDLTKRGCLQTGELAPPNATIRYDTIQYPFSIRLARTAPHLTKEELRPAQGICTSAVRTGLVASAITRARTTAKAQLSA